MQLIEVSVTGVRSAVITLQGRDTPLRFTLFPMIHLGTPAFYQEVAGRLAQCQVIVAEGVGGGSVLTRALTMAYRTPAKSKQLNLVVQKIDFGALAAGGANVIRPDFSAEQVRRGWRTVPWIQRLAVVALAPAFGLALRLFGTRRVLGRYLGAEDLPTEQDHQVREALPALNKMIMDDRDRLLVNALISVVDECGGEPVVVGVVYGADHMVSVVRGLATQGYRPRRAEWITVFDF